VLELADAIVGGDAKAAVEHIGASAEKGLQLGELLDQLTDHWRGMMLAAVGGVESAELSELAAEKVKQHTSTTNLDAILAGLEILTATKQKLKGSPHAQVLLEIAAVRLAKLSELLSVAELAQWYIQTPPAGGQSPSPRLPAQPQGGGGESVKKKVLTPPEVEANGTHSATGPSSTEGSNSGEEPLSVVWERVLEQVGPILAANLRQAAISQANFGPNSLVVPFPAAYNNACETVKIERNQETLRKALKHITGRDWTLRVVRMYDPASDRTVIEAPPPEARRPARSRSELLALPFFAALGETLGGQLMRTDDGFDPFADPTATPDADPTPAPPDLDET